MINFVLKKLERTALIAAIDTALEAYIRWEDFNPEKADTLAKWCGFIGGVIFGSVMFGVICLCG